MTPPKTILVGVCGGVAAYKALDVVSGLRKRGHEVRVVMSEAATRFVTPTAFAAVSGAPVLTHMWPDASQGDLEARFPHLYPSTRADVFLLIPATANSVAKIAQGIGDNLLSTSALSLPGCCVKIFCPAMNVEMWNNPAVRENVDRLEARGWIRLGPDAGPLACGVTGEGRLREPAELLKEIDDLLGARDDLSGKRILITSGPTHEYLDPVRFLGNASSGKMGLALAREARSRGAEVVFVTGPVPDAHLPGGVELHRVVSAGEMLEASRKAFATCDAAVFAAAVADFRPQQRQERKQNKTNQPIELLLEPNPDIAATLCAGKPKAFFAVGFALQSHDGEEHAREKLVKKRLDGIVLNTPESLGSEEGRFSYLAEGASRFEDWGLSEKAVAARRLMEKIALNLDGKQR